MTTVIYDHQVFSWQGYGGISRYFYELAKRVNASEGFSASVIAPLYVNNYLAAGGVNTKGIHIADVPRARRVVDIANRYIESAMLKASQPDVVHETYYRHTSSAPKGCPVVITVHDMIPERSSSGFTRADATSKKKRAAVERADRIVCVSENTRKDLLELFEPDPQKIRTIHLGFSFTGTGGNPSPPSQPRPYFLYVGLRGGYKNFCKLLSAYASHAWLRNEFDLIAFGSHPFTRQEGASINALGLTSLQVRHLSGDDTALGHLYANATALVYPSLYEGFGIPPLEAMGSGCPVLCSDTSSIPEIVGDGGLYFDPRSIDAIVDAMERVASGAELRSDLVTRGKNRARLFSWDRCAAETLDVYRDLLH
jgi:glycosyltransferase involved in cell wall biosynthesis